MKNFLFIPLFLALFISEQPILSQFAQTPAFPGAEGGGMYTTGGRGGRIIYVDNLNNKGDGSLRKAIEAEGPRTIVFRVSGNIVLEKTLHIQNNDLTIAGQTAPGQGITLIKYGIRLDADNVIIRFIRVRPGDISKEDVDAISGIGHKNIIIDHCSFSWAIDEVASFYDNANFSLQYCIISESFYNSNHVKGEHGYGGIWGGLNASFHHNLLSDHTSRNPRLCGPRYTGKPENEKVDFRNNLIYNWGFNSVYGGEEGSYNMVNNYYKPGPATEKDVMSRILNLTQVFYNHKINPDTLGAGWFYISGNVMEGNPEVTKNNWNGGVTGKNVDAAAIAKSRLTAQIPYSPIRVVDANTAYNQILRSAGASLSRDDVDKRILKEVKTAKEKFGNSFEGGANGIIDSQTDVGGWPELKSKEAPIDSDQDGMPDKWEKKFGLNSQDASDGNNYDLNKSYSNFEMYINSLVEKVVL